MKNTLLITLALILGALLGYYFSPIDRVEVRLEILREKTNSELLYSECLQELRVAISPFRGSLKDYPSSSFMNLMDQCIKIKNTENYNDL